MVLLSFAGLQSASAECAMMTHADAGPGAEHEHSLPSHHEGGQTHSTSSNPTQVCALTMACAAAAPSVASTVLMITLGAEQWLPAPANAHLSPSLAFEPPPPRASLI